LEEVIFAVRAELAQCIKVLSALKCFEGGPVAPGILLGCTVG
jgi:hypothetical protein